MLNCLHSNKTLKRLELAGNNVPSDILKAVGKYYLLQRCRAFAAPGERCPFSPSQWHSHGALRCFLSSLNEG